MKLTKDEFFSLLENKKINNFSINGIKYYTKENIFDMNILDSLITSLLTKINNSKDKKKLLPKLSILGIMSAQKSFNPEFSKIYKMDKKLFDKIVEEINTEINDNNKKNIKSVKTIKDKVKVGDDVIFKVPLESGKDISLLKNHPSEVLTKIKNEREFKDNPILHDYEKYYNDNYKYFVFGILDESDLDVIKTTILNKISDKVIIDIIEDN